MPKRKKLQEVLTRSRNNQSPSYSTGIRWGESYMSLLLGIVVVVILAVLVVSSARNLRLTETRKSQPAVSSDRIKEALVEKKPAVVEEKTTGSTYTVAAGEHLWQIAEKHYKSGYNWVDIAKANNISNPDIVPVGTKLIIPKVEAKVLTVAQSEQKVTMNSPNAIQGATYKVKTGDYLWDIAVRAYGDGFRWVEIARANSIPNPDLIYPDTELKIPR